MTDYYSILGISRTANPDEIKRAYRKLASQHHPDKGGDTKKFQEVEEAYRILGDPQKREEYDNPPQQNFGNFHFSQTGMPPDFEDFFSRAFGENTPFSGMFGRRNSVPRNRTLNIQTTISLEDAFHGKDLVATIGLPNGKEQVVNIKIPAGVQDGTVLRLAGMGDDTVANAPRGDIHLTVNIIPHQRFHRQGDDLICTIDLNCIDAILGKKFYIDTIDNKTLELVIKPGTQHAQILSAPGYGMPKLGDNRFKGRLLINVSITIPTNLTDEQKQILEQYFK